jgi:hypothetical protein
MCTTQAACWYVQACDIVDRASLCLVQPGARPTFLEQGAATAEGWLCQDHKYPCTCFDCKAIFSSICGESYGSNINSLESGQGNLGRV